jgi:hypothetical protein
MSKGRTNSVDNVPDAELVTLHEGGNWSELGLPAEEVEIGDKDDFVRDGEKSCEDRAKEIVSNLGGREDWRESFTSRETGIAIRGLDRCETKVVLQEAMNRLATQIMKPAIEEYKLAKKHIVENPITLTLEGSDQEALKRQKDVLRRATRDRENLLIKSLVVIFTREVAQEILYEIKLNVQSYIQSNEDEKTPEDLALEASAELFAQEEREERKEAVLRVTNKSELDRREARQLLRDAKSKLYDVSNMLAQLQAPPASSVTGVMRAADLAECNGGGRGGGGII